MYAPDVLLAVVAGAVAGGGLLLLAVALRGLPPRTGPARGAAARTSSAP